MCNQNIISNKFDLKLVTTFSSYWWTAIFTKSRSLHYILKKQRKLISIIWTTLKKGTTTSKSTYEKRKRRQKNNDAHQPTARILASNAEKPTFKERTMLPEQKMTCRNRTSISTSQNGMQNNNVEKRRSQKFTDHSKDLKNPRSLNKRI